MSDSLSRIEAISAIASTAPAPSPTAVHKVAVPAVTAPKPEDNATLSTTAQMTVLKQDGLTAEEIALSLNIPLVTVQADLGLSTATANASVAAA